ncbi:hypothetical protein F5148DRAFT_1147929 [Russula earlei]|uniref:Uncharacterized protein n=1 Tax=Russula earlei TaxID=71964 RepID=A0ACC0UEF4_9AGAM|nr:hypothetical protein F5148DRAFT_1147929 [Russula earlei]
MTFPEVKPILPCLEKQLRPDYKDMAGDACEKFVGPMPICEFLSEFIPKASQDRPAINFNFEHNSVSQNEGHFIKMIKACRLCPQLTFINTTSRPDGSIPFKPDISIYCSGPPEKPLDWKAVDLWIKNKNKGDDIFLTPTAYKICGQLITYASTLHHSQFCLFSFAIVLFSKSGRLLQWDRSGLIYSKPFNWVEKHNTLFEFIWRLNFLSDTDCGQDTTVISVVPNDEATVAISKLNEYKGLMIKKVKPKDLCKFLVHDDHAADGQQLKFYITAGPIWHMETLFGRSTFGYIAYDIKSLKLIIEGPRRKGTCIGNYTGRKCLTSWCLVELAMFLCHRTMQIRFRLLCKGQRRKTMRKGKGKTNGAWVDQTLTPHAVAYKRTKILHRDVSAGNILIRKDGSGILIDWDLSKKEDMDAQPRGPSQTV